MTTHPQLRTLPRTAALIIAGSIATLLVPHSAQAANETWDGGAGGPSWGAPFSWLSDIAAPGSTIVTTSTDVATFNTAIANTWGNAVGNPVVIDPDRNIGGITFSGATGNYFIGSSGGNALKLSNAGTIQMSGLTATNAMVNINAPLVLHGGYTFSNNSTNGSGAGAGTLNIGGNITNAVASTLSLTGSNTNANTISGVIGGAGPTLSVAKSGSGTWVLSGANTYTGATTITAGVLRSANQGALSTTSSVAVSSGATLAVNYGGVSDYSEAQVGTLLGKTTFGSPSATLGFDTTNAVGAATYGSVLSMAAGGVTKLGAGTLTLTGANTYSGATTVSAGVLNIQHSSALGSTIGGTSVGGGATLQLENVIGGAVGEALTLINSGTLRNVSGSNTWSGSISVVSVGPARITSDFGGLLTVSGSVGLVTPPSTLAVGGAGNTIISGPITGPIPSSQLFKDGSGTLTLSAANIHSGSTFVGAGTLALGHVNALQNSTLNTGGSGAQQVTFTVAGTNTYNLGGLTGADELAIGANTLSVGANNQSNTYSGVIQGLGGLTKRGSGTQTLSGVSTYAGNTTIKAGTLKLDAGGNLINTANLIVGDAGSSGAILDVTTKTGGLTIGGAQTISGIGQVNGNTIILGTHAPGNSPGLQTFNGNLGYSTGSTVNWELATNAVGTRGTDFDGVNVVSTGVFSIASGVTSNLIFNAIGSTVDWSNPFWTSNHSWLVYDDVNLPALASLAIFDTITVSPDSLAATLTGGTFSWSQSGNDVLLNYTAVPEPTSALLLLGSGALLLLRRRRRAAAAR